MKRLLRIRSRIALVAAAIAAMVATAATPTTAQQQPPPVRATGLTSTYQWSSTGPVISPQPDANHPVVSVKDPTVVRYNGEWLVYMTTADTSGAWGLAYTSFSDWSQAPSAPQQFLDTNPNLTGWYTAAPQLFYFAPRDEWYLVYQTGPPSYSVSRDPTDPNSWSAPRQFMDVGGLLDFWVICDDAMCYLFSADDDGRVYRAETTVGEFPGGFRNNQVVLQDPDPRRLFEGGAVYKVDGTDQYLLIWEAGDSQWRRYYRAFTATSLDGPWEPLAAEESNPFARSNNVSFPDGAWTENISHGELIRSGHDQRMTIDPCNLQLLYQGHSSDIPPDTPYSQIPYRLALATQTNSDCGGTGSGQVIGTGSGKCLDVPGQSTADGTQTQLWDCWGASNQQWTLSPSGELSVYSGSSRRCLDALGGGTENGTAAIIWTCNGGSNQRWTLNGDGTIRSVQSGLCLDVSGWGTANGTPVHLWTCHGGANQQWTLT
ncbi:non-reducing end alpha-L-arabinofuranosidase family hydrolase [Streptomyces sp. 8K308]|uniref:non-reducing end alpha-L-arabinofuranosidase family hydrolase n=1 Tax=Streptomyces sp. 8K308 TaxID=2530388 RepID=UPI001FB5DBF6|nr:non-reducing end alpha-L-arabinofuranosidase family hydrolase [Streptomyces sp. 8K308]